VEKQCVTYSECVFVVLIIQKEESLRVLYCHLWSVRLYRILLHYLINGAVLGEMLLSIKFVFRFYLHILSETFLILRIIEKIWSKIYFASCKVPLFFSYFDETWIFSTDFLKIIKYQNSRISVQWQRVFEYGQMDGRTAGRTDGWTDRYDEANSRFS